MKKLIIAILAAVLASGAFAQQIFPDIPEGHWAGDAVERIADLNIVIGFPDGTFRGNEAFTRYQAALVVSRLLDVIAENMDAALAMTNEDIASLRNAVQELSSDVAAQGTRLSAAEGAIAGLSDDVTGQNARLEELESALANLDTDVDPAVLRDLQNQIASQRVAIDTAQATADQALARANAAGSQADANAAEIAALNELIQMLGDQIEALQGAGGDPFDPSGLEGRVARNEGDIANIREFVILLRRDQVALRDRVSALEASDEQQNADITDLQDRVTAIEENPLGLSGEIELEYFVGRFSGVGTEFDVDRAYGVGMPRDMGTSVFSSGTDEDGNTEGDDDEVDEPGEFAEDRADIDYTSTFSADVSIEIGQGFEFGGQGSPRGLNSFEAVVNFEFFEVETVDGDTAYALGLDDFTATFDPIGMDPVTFAFGEEVDAFFTPYTLNREDEIGFVATIGAPDFLAFLDPTLQVAYLSGGFTADTADDEDLLVDAVTTGIRATVSPLDGVTLGGTLVRNSMDVDGGADADLGDNIDEHVWGVDLQAALGPVALAAEYASGFSEGDDLATAADDYDEDILFVTADATFDILGGVEFAANYRDIAAGWEASFGNGYDLTDEGDYPFEDDQVGFAVEAGLGLFIFDVDVFFDSYTTTVPVADTTAFGVDAAAELFAGFSLTAFYQQVSIDGAVADDNDATERDNAYETGFGVGVVHDGEAENALVPNLDLELAYEQLGAGFDETHILADASYDLSVSIVNLTPYVTFESYNDADDLSDDTSELSVGTGLTTEPLDIFLAPSLEAAVNYRTNAHTDVAGGDFTSTEMQWSVGLNLSEFLLENSALTVRYGSYTGTNISDEREIIVDGEVVESDPATNISNGDEAGTGTQSVSGYEVVWNYFDLELSYGVYTHDADFDAGSTTAQAFGVTYTVAF